MVVSMNWKLSALNRRPRRINRHVEEQGTLRSRRLLLLYECNNRILEKSAQNLFGLAIRKKSRQTLTRGALRQGVDIGWDYYTWHLHLGARSVDQDADGIVWGGRV
jgi:hypothetical protein